MLAGRASEEATPVAPHPERLVVGSRNPAKVTAAERAVAGLGWNCALVPAEVPSGVDAQPRGLAAVRRGAATRARSAAHLHAGAWGVGMENGLCRWNGQLAVIGWCAVCSEDTELAGAAPPAFLLPPAFTLRLGDAVWKGDQTLSAACAEAFGGDPEAWARTGVVRQVTGGAVDRQALWLPAVTLALASAAWIPPGWRGHA